MSKVADKAPQELTAIFARMEVPIEVAATQEKGKHVRALKALPKGSALFEENPLVCWPFEATVTSNLKFCDHCFATNVAPEKWIKCPLCTAVYCSPECAAAAKDSHRTLCGLEGKLRTFMEENKASGDSASTPITVESLARCVAVMVQRLRRAVVQVAPNTKASADLDDTTWAALFNAAVEPFNRFVEPPRDSKFEDIDAYSWCAAVRDILNDRVLKMVFNNASVCTGMLSDATLLTLLGQLSLNAQAINHTHVVEDGTKKDVSVAGGIFTLQSNFNHSCSPNCSVQFTESNEISLVVDKDVQEGDELCITYIPTIFLECESTEQRRERLKPYFFNCACTRCSATEEKK